MDGFMKLSREAQIVIGGSVLLLIVSFLDWQQISFGPISAGANEWHGIGLLAGLLLFALLAWEAVRLFGVKVSLGSLSDGMVSVGLALLVALFTVIYFLSHGDARHWPAWVGLILAIVVGIAAVLRARAEGVQMPAMASASTAAAAPPASMGSTASMSPPETTSAPSDEGMSSSDPGTET